MKHRPLLATVTVLGASCATTPQLPATETGAARTAAPPAVAPALGSTLTHHIFALPDRTEWRPGPPSLPPGAHMTVIEGDPSKPGLFTMRLRLPDGYRVRPHYHAADEHVTVITGTFLMSVGETFDESRGTALPEGGFAVMPAGTRHYAWTRGETVIQIHAVGPWKLTYVNPGDDPRNARP
ncbi:MAG: cupin domain-containing protein [Gemmatimonadaceae bacterium]